MKGFVGASQPSLRNEYEEYCYSPENCTTNVAPPWLPHCACRELCDSAPRRQALLVSSIFASNGELDTRYNNKLRSYRLTKSGVQAAI
jgi:hypothetical protein